MATIISPCIRVCTVSGRSGLCEGCGRSLREIAGWSQLSVQEREAIMASLPARMAQFNSLKSEGTAQ